MSPSPIKERGNLEKPTKKPHERKKGQEILFLGHQKKGGITGKRGEKTSKWGRCLFRKGKYIVKGEIDRGDMLPFAEKKGGDEN